MSAYESGTGGRGRDFRGGRGGGRGGRFARGGRGRGRGRGGNPGTSERWYKPSEWYRLSEEEKSEVRQKRANRVSAQTGKREVGAMEEEDRTWKRTKQGEEDHP